MSLEAQIERLNVNLEKLLAAGGIASAPAAPAKGAAKKAADAAAVAAATKPETPAQTVAALQATPAEREVTKADIAAAGEDLTKLVELNRAKAVSILGEFGVPKMTALDTKRIPELHAKVKAALAELAPAASPSLI